MPPFSTSYAETLARGRSSPNRRSMMAGQIAASSSTPLPKVKESPSSRMR